MNQSPKNQLGAEWQLMQKQFDVYEVYSLVIKLVSIVLASVAILFLELSDNGHSLSAAFLICVLWLQDAIWKTFQSRIETRLLELETAFNNGSDDTPDFIPFQFNTHFNEQRPGSAGLCLEYLKQTTRPTIAFPHAVLVVLVLLF